MSTPARRSSHALESGFATAHLARTVRSTLRSVFLPSRWRPCIGTGTNGWGLGIRDWGLGNRDWGLGIGDSIGHAGGRDNLRNAYSGIDPSGVRSRDSHHAHAARAGAGGE